MSSDLRDNDLENLFRSRLEENEVEPDPGLTGRFMGRLARREFFRFNLSRFNIWYLTAAAAAVTAAAVIFLGGGGETVAGGGRDDSAGQLEAVAEAVAPAAGRTEEMPEKGSTVMKKAPATAERPAAKASPADGGSAAREKSATGRAASGEAREAALLADNMAGESIAVISVGNRDAAGRLPAAAAKAPLAAEATVTSGCLPLHVRFSSNAETGSRVEWSFGDGGRSSLAEPEYIYDVPGRYSVVLHATDSRGRTATAGLMIEVWERPRAAFEVRRNDQLSDGGKVQFINISTGAVDYLWDFGDGTFSTLADPTYRYPRGGTYDVRLVAWSAEGCADSVIVKDLFTDGGMFIRFPSAFAPDRGGPTGGYYNTRSDEQNRVFHPVTSGVAGYNLRIYSRAGLLVFESNDPEMGWDGYHKGALCAPGVYVWKVRGTYRNGETFIMAGDVTLLSY